jgi:hypothetical protein
VWFVLFVVHIFNVERSIHRAGFNHEWTQMDTDGWLNRFSRKKAESRRADNFALLARLYNACPFVAGEDHPHCRPDVLIGLQHPDTRVVCFRDRLAVL